jgi:hypothetical protein
MALTTGVVRLTARKFDGDDISLSMVMTTPRLLINVYTLDRNSVYQPPHRSENLQRLECVFEIKQ